MVYTYMHDIAMHAAHALRPHVCTAVRFHSKLTSRLLMDFRRQWVKERSNELGKENERSFGDHTLHRFKQAIDGLTEQPENLT